MHLPLHLTQKMELIPTPLLQTKIRNLKVFNNMILAPVHEAFDFFSFTCTFKSFSIKHLSFLIPPAISK